MVWLCSKSERKVISTKSWKITLNFLHFFASSFGFRAWWSIFFLLFVLISFLILFHIYTCHAIIRIRFSFRYFLYFFFYFGTFWLTLYFKENERYLSWFPVRFFRSVFYGFACVPSSGVLKLQQKKAEKKLKYKRSRKQKKKQEKRHLLIERALWRKYSITKLEIIVFSFFYVKQTLNHSLSVR